MSRAALEFHPAAISEARAARQWYATRSPQAGDAFLAELDRAIERICEVPSRWPSYLHGTRRYLLHRFPYLVIYREIGPTLQVVAVAHGRRRPGYWKRR